MYPRDFTSATGSGDAVEFCAVTTGALGSSAHPYLAGPADGRTPCCSSSLKLASMVRSSLPSSASTTGRDAGSTTPINPSSIDLRRRQTWIDEPPYSRISVTASSR